MIVPILLFTLIIILIIVLINTIIDFKKESRRIDAEIRLMRNDLDELFKEFK